MIFKPVGSFLRLITCSKANLVENCRQLGLSARMQFKLDASLKGMKELDREKFRSEMSVPAVKIPKSEFGRIKRLLASFTCDNFNKQYQNLDERDPLNGTHKYILLDPDLFDIEKLDEAKRDELLSILKQDNARNIQLTDGMKNLIEKRSVNVTYEDLKFEDVLKAILPDSILNDNISAKSYSVIGHVAHFNLKEQILDYKHIIGQVLIDKMPQIKTVVNKVNEIDNTYRNFQFEILAGANDTNVSCRENGCEFRFDFAKVYWNPRLGTEHERVVNMLKTDDVVYDVFAGVGPFSVPAVAKSNVRAVLANDLNPESFRCLVENHARNIKSKTKRREQDNRKSMIQSTKKADKPVLTSSFTFDPIQQFQAFNLDGREFITSKLKYHLIEMLKYRLLNDEMTDILTGSKFYVLMNLPAMSIEFLDSFCGLYNLDEIESIRQHFPAEFLIRFRLNIFCYHFCKGEDIELEILKNLIRSEIFGDETIEIESKYVRKVAPNKNMYCSMFTLRFEHMLMKKSEKTGAGIKHRIEEIVEGFYERGGKIKKTD